MTELNYERAIRNKMRFPSPKGDLSLEQLWDLPLQARNGFDLDTVAKTINAELKGISEESFVDRGSNPRKGELEYKLELVKHVIATQQEENLAALTKARAREERQKLEAILATKQASALESLTEEQIQARLDALPKG